MATPAPAPRLFEPSRRLLLVGLLSLVTIVAAEAMAVANVMPMVERDLGDLWLYGWVFSAFQLGTLVGIVVGGRSADRVNPAVPLTAGMVVFCVGLVIAGIAPSMAVLVAGRALQGFGAGTIPTVAYVCIGRGFPAELRPKVFALMSTAWLLPSLLAPLVAPAVANAFGWRWVFLGLIPLAVLTGAIAARAVRRLGDPVPHADDGAGRTAVVLRLAMGAGFLLAGFTSDTPLSGVPLVLLGVVMAAPAFRRLTPPGTLRLRPRLPAAVGLRGILTFSFFSADAFVPLALTSVRGRSEMYAGFVLATGAVTWAVGSWLQARLADSWGSARLVRLGATILVASLGVYAVGLLAAVPTSIWFLGSALAGLGIGTAYSPLSVTTLGEAEPGREGAATTSLQLSDVFGIAVGTGVAGAIVAAGDRIYGTNGPATVAVFAMAACASVGVFAGAGRLVAGRVQDSTASTAAAPVAGS